MDSYTLQYKNIIVPIILHYLPNTHIILYGSRARKDEHEGSDIDIALDIGKKIDDKIMNFIITKLEESSLPINFDLVDFHAISKQLQTEIIKEGIIWQ